MPKQTYVPTEADRLTGANVRKLRRLHSETLIETLERSGLQLGQSSLSRIELGERPLSLPEATKLAAHFGTTAERIICKTWPASAGVDTPPTEQEWLGNQPTELFAVPDHIAAETDYVNSRTLTVNLDNPLTLDEYREQVWIPYLEARYSADLKAS
jgi:transcriptional regulator with XRE-family HTH domain